MPQSLCSWDYRVQGATAGPVLVTFNYFTEQGGISVGPASFTIRKHGPFSGHWTLEHEARTVAEARKPSALFRSFEMTFAERTFTVQACSAFSRKYELLLGGQAVGAITPAHAFTRRAWIECEPAVPELAQCFAFWLAALTWRRAAQNNNS